MLSRTAKSRRWHGIRKKMIMIGCFLLITAACYSFPPFRVSEIQIQGCRVLSPEAIQSAAGLEKGAHLLEGIGGSVTHLFQLRHIDRERILRAKYPYIKSVSIRSRFPSKISVVIEERIEIAYIAIRDGYVMIDATGIALEVIEKGTSSSASVPVIEGIQANAVRLGEKIEVDMDDYLKQSVVLLNDVLNADHRADVGVDLLTRMKSIRPVKDRLIFVTIALPEKDKTLLARIRHSERTLEDLIWLKYAIDQGVFDGDVEGILDLTTTERFFTS